MFKSGFVTIIGEPNSGKSTLLNSILKEKVSIVTKRKNTTRNQIRGIYNTTDSQIVFIDTPGFIESGNKLNSLMKKAIVESIDGVDIVLILIPFWKELDIEKLSTFKLDKQKNIFAVITQIDKAENRNEVLEKIAQLSSLNLFKEIIPISALKKKNMDRLLEVITSYLEEGVPYYETDKSNDLGKEFYISEIVREKLLLYLNKEIPHNLFVRTEPTKIKNKTLHIYSEIIISRDSLKKIIIGKNGEVLKKVGSAARIELERKFNKKIFIELRVIVKDDWMNKDSILKEI